METVLTTAQWPGRLLAERCHGVSAPMRVHHSLDEATDADIIEASRNNPEAFGTIFERHFDAIYHYLYQRVPVGDAEDAVGEVFEIAVRKRVDFVAMHASALPWLYGIASRVAAHRRRSAGRQAKAYGRAASYAGVSEVSPITGATERVAAKSTVDALRPAIERMSERDQNILHLYACAELSYSGIAEALGIPVGTVRSRLHRIRKTLRRSMQTTVGGVA